MGGAIVQGILLGLLLTVLIGPVFFVLIETSLRRGVRAALWMDLGVFVSDVTFILLGYVFTSELESLQESDEGILRIIGGSVFIVFGIATFFKDKKAKKPPKEKKPIIRLKLNSKFWFVDIVKGFLLNGLNPSVLFFWIGMVAIAQNRYSGDDLLIGMFFSSLLITFFMFDIIKIIGANALKKFITPRFLVLMNKTIGIGLTVFGLVMAISAIP